MQHLELASFAALSGVYTELRLHENTTVNISLMKGNLTANTRTAAAGVSARVHDGGRWGMAAAPDCSEAGVRHVLAQAARNARSMTAAVSGAGSVLERSCTGRNETDFHTRQNRLSAKDVMDILRETDAHIETKFPKLQSRMVMLRCFHHEKQLATSDGAVSSIFLPRSHVYVIMTAEKDGAPVEVWADICGGRGEFEDFFLSMDGVYKAADEAYEQLMAKCEGVYPEAGVHECILMPELSGILAHEAIGHTVEADLVRGGSVAADFYDKEVASPLISLVDFAHTAYGETCPVPVYVDDEGTAAQDAVIIDKGILKGYLHNRETAAQYGVKPQGCARGFAYYDEPLIRMRNTAILKGESKLSDMIASIDNGYLLMKTGNGQADFTGEFMFAVTCGYEIKKGKLGRAILDTTVSGVAFDMLKTVKAVSDDFQWLSSGFCGKKQMMSVGMSGPAIQCDIRIGGQ